MSTPIIFETVYPTYHRTDPTIMNAAQKLASGGSDLEKDSADKFWIAKFVVERPTNLVREGDRLHVLVSTLGLCQNLWNARDVGEFKRIFRHCLEYHYHAYHSGRIPRRDIGENDLMIFRVDKSADAVGILNDFDMATKWLPDALVSTTHYRTRTLQFMALELVDSDETEPSHLYRHDLKSFFYILIWAAIHYDFESQKKRDTPAVMGNWLDPDAAAQMKRKLTTGPHFHSVITPLVLAPFEELWETWVVPLRVLFGQAFYERTYGESKTGFDNTTINGRVTFKKFMAAIREIPRGPNSKGTVQTSD